MQFCMPMNPIRYNGDATVVSDGSTSSSKMMLSKPTTLTSSGTRTPSLRSPFMTPIASASLYASTAVASSWTIRRAALNPARMVGSFGAVRRTHSPRSPVASRSARHRAPSDQLLSGPATYTICSCPSALRCSAARRIPRRLSVRTQLASGSVRFNSTTAFCLATMRSAESVIRELAITMPSTWLSSFSMVWRSTSGDSLVCQRISWYRASRAASYAPLMMSP